jgi:hypothetical protein
MIVLILLCRFAMASPGPELDLEFLIKDNVEMPKGINTPMCFCGDKCNLVRCTVLGYAYGMSVGGYPKNSEYYPNTSDRFQHVQ